MKRDEKWYQRRLAAYCEKWYGKYEDELEFWTDPNFNQWQFDIPSLNLRAVLTCDATGLVGEKRTKIRGDQ